MSQLVIYLSDFTHKIIERSEQELTSCVISIIYPKLPCRICAKKISDKDKDVQHDLCELWVNIKCNNLNYLNYRYVQNKENPGIV